MSIIGPQPSRQELAPAASINAELLPIKQAVEDLVLRGVEGGAIKPEVVEFAASLVGTERTASLIVPTYDLVTTFGVMSAANDPDTRPDTIYYSGYRADSTRQAGTRGETRHYASYGHILAATWGKKWDPRLETHYITGGSLSSDVQYTLDLVASPSREELEALLKWHEEQKTVLGDLEQQGPMGQATALVESAFGGIDITNPESAVRELSARLILAASIERQFKGNEYRTELGQDVRLFEPRLQMLFWQRHGKAFGEYLTNAKAMAQLAGGGESFDPTRMPQLSEMFTRDTQEFLTKVWDDLERLCAVEQLGRKAMEEIIRAIW